MADGKTNQTQTSREAYDEASAKQAASDAQDALQEALDAHRELKHANADLERATMARDAAHRRYVAACAKLLPFRRLAQVAA